MHHVNVKSKAIRSSTIGLLKMTKEDEQSMGGKFQNTNYFQQDFGRVIGCSKCGRPSI